MSRFSFIDIHSDEDVSVAFSDIVELCKLYANLNNYLESLEEHKTEAAKKYGIQRKTRGEVLCDFLEKNLGDVLYKKYWAKVRLERELKDIFKIWLKKLGKDKSYNIKTLYFRVNKKNNETAFFYAESLKGVSCFDMVLDFGKRKFTIYSSIEYPADAEITELIYKEYKPFQDVMKCELTY